MVDKICFDLNCYKFFKLNVEPCAETLFYVYIWFYNWPDQSPVNLINHLDAVTENTKKKLRQYFNRHEIGKLTKMRDNESILRGFDISFYYKVGENCQYCNIINHATDTTNTCQIEAF